MQIKLDRKFEINFNIIFEYIAKDKLSASKKFKKELFEQIKIFQTSHINLENHIILMMKKLEI